MTREEQEKMIEHIDTDILLNSALNRTKLYVIGYEIPQNDGVKSFFAWSDNRYEVRGMVETLRDVVVESTLCL